MDLMASRTLLFLAVWAISSSCSGQNIAEAGHQPVMAEKSAVKIGRPVSAMDKKIMAVYQDKGGNHWFCSGDQGVYRYDGKSLLLISVEDGLLSNTVLGIQEDRLGNLFFETARGVSKLDGQKFRTLEVIENSASENEWQLAPDDLWFRLGTYHGGPYRYDGQSLSHLAFPKSDRADAFFEKYPNASFNPYGIYTIYKDSDGAVWFGTASLGVWRYDGQSLKWLYEKQLTETPAGGDFGIRAIAEDKAGYFWFCNTRFRYEILADSPETRKTNRIAYRREAGIGVASETEEEFPYFLSIAKDDQGDLWMATYDDGVWRNDGKKLIHYPVEDDALEVLLFSIYKDNQGVIWLGSHNAGAYRFNGEAFEKFKSP